MQWKRMSNVNIDLEHSADGEWRLLEDGNQTKLEVRSNGLEATLTITPATHPDSYEALAELTIKELNSGTRRGFA